jgi:hypothetical protein
LPSLGEFNGWLGRPYHFLTQQIGQLGDIRRNPSRLIAAQ